MRDPTVEHQEHLDYENSASTIFPTWLFIEEIF